MRTYCVIQLAGSGALIKADEEPLSVTWNTGASPTQLCFVTTRSNKALGSIPRYLSVESRCSAADLETAIDLASEAGNLAAAVLVVAANATIPPLQLERAYETTEGATNRQFWQNITPTLPQRGHRGRFVERSSTIGLFEALLQHPERGRLLRACAQYAMALTFWHPGFETQATEHFFMAAEALAEACLRSEAARLGLTTEQIGKEWIQDFAAIDERKRRGAVIAEARRRLVFHDDEECHRLTKLASDGFEHGFEDLREVRRLAMKVRGSASQHVRRAIIQLAVTDHALRRSLLDESMVMPIGPMHVSTEVSGQLHGSGILGAQGSPHPGLEDASVVERAERSEDGALVMRQEVTGRLELPPGIQARFATTTRVPLTRPDAKDVSIIGTELRRNDVPVAGTTQVWVEGQEPKE